jgi:hypothetical protein
MKTHCLINLGGTFATNDADKVAKYIDRLDGDVIAFTYARMHLEEINMYEWHAIHIYACEYDKKRITAISNLLTTITKKPKEVYFIGNAKLGGIGYDMFMAIREQWPTAKVFTEKQILS